MTVTKDSTVAEIKTYLDSIGVDYKTNDNKSSLLALAGLSDDVSSVQGQDKDDVSETVNAPVSESNVTSPVSTVDETMNEEPAPVVPYLYVVQPGDELWRIATDFGMSLGRLAALNNLRNTAVVKVGRKLKLA